MSQGDEEGSGDENVKAIPSKFGQALQWSSRTQESLLFCFSPEIRKTQDKKNLNRFEDTFASVTQVVQRF